MSHAATATIWLHGARLDEIAVGHGEDLEIGPTGQVRVPAPEGAPFLLRATWTGPAALLVTDAAERRHRVGPHDALELEVGPIRVELRVTERFWLRRLGDVPWGASLPWFATVLAFSVVLMQVDLVWRHRCDWFGVGCPAPAHAANTVDAEYLARLLRKDFAGEDQGVRGAVREVPAEARKLGDAYLPAGDPEGPKETPGGAEQVAPKPQRTLPPPGEAVAPAPKVATEAPTEADALRKETPADAHQGLGRDAAGVDPEAEDAPVQPDLALAEERRGWGLPDWLDTTQERREIDLMLRLSQRRLRLDPDDRDALSVLSYYQYLADDLDAAEATYDRMIELDPTDSAAYNNQALVFKRRGEYAKEEGLYRVALALDPENGTTLNNLAVNLAHQGKTDEALAIMQRVETILPDDPYSDLHRCKIHAQRGEDDVALGFLQKALDGMTKLDTLHHIEFRQDLRVDPSLERLRKDPRFLALLRRYYGGDAPVQE